MSLLALVIGTILVLIIVFIVINTFFLNPNLKKETPQVPIETYLYYDPLKPSPTLSQAKSIAKKFSGKISNLKELNYYALLGGSAGWCGIISSGEVVAVPGALYSPYALVTHQPCNIFPPNNYGVWITGPKAVAGLKNISPFNCKKWYQPHDNS